MPIRERLRVWEAENSDRYVPVIINDSAEPGSMENSSARIQDNRFEIDEDDVVDDSISNVGFEDLADIGSRRGFLIPGDLVEVMCVCPLPCAPAYANVKLTRPE